MKAKSKKIRKYQTYEIGRIVSIKGTEPYFFNIILKPETLLESGPLAQILDIFYMHRIPILQIKSAPSRDGEPVKVVITADMKGKEQKLAQIVSEVAKIDGVTSVEYEPPLFNGVAIDMWSYPPTFQGQRVLIIRRAISEEMLREGWRRIGPDFAALLYYAYFHGALNLYREYFKKIPRKEDQVNLVKELFRLLGYGIAEVLKVTETEARVRIYDSFECRALKNAGEARGGIIRGMIAGWAAGYWNAEYGEITIREVKCIAKGDPYCEYIIKRRKT